MNAMKKEVPMYVLAILTTNIDRDTRVDKTAGVRLLAIGTSARWDGKARLAVVVPSRTLSHGKVSH